MNEQFALYLGKQYGPKVEAKYREIASSSKPVRFPRTSKKLSSKQARRRKKKAKKTNEQLK
ncbi:hypothetical protein NG791_16850 [Laspinema sp. D1]|uniref:hypothetical protein n=1 Tax=Laspinema palackyanum TaxID=3231601 RepID=UPI00348B8E63|nr:hypothetical protein [Laspinema sp. D2b]